MSQNSQTSQTGEFIIEEKRVFEGLCEALETTYQEFVGELEDLWEETKGQLEASFQQCVCDKMKALEALQCVRMQGHEYQVKMNHAKESFQTFFSNV